MKKTPVKTLATALLLALGSAGAQAEPFETIINNGSSQNRVDIAVLGDGYTASEAQIYKNDVQAFIAGFFAQEPLREYQRYFNVHRIDVVSNQSGADHPETGVFVDTALDATYNCNGIQRLICVNPTKVNNIIANTLGATQHDVTLVIVNDSEYGGSGGAVAVASTNEAAVELILHEEGHSFGLLGDEYGGPPPPACDNSMEPPFPNATKATQRALIKWNAWIDPGTPIPTPGTDNGVPGLYEGADYCDMGLYRPTYGSKMRILGPPYEQINTEQLIKRTHNFVSPLDSSAPTGSNITLSRGSTQEFSVSTTMPFTHTLMVGWLVDGQQQATGSMFVLNSGNLTDGNHTVMASINDPTAAVRNDPSHLLTAQRNWTVVVVTPPAAPTANAATSVTTSSFTANWSSVSGSTGYRLDVSTSNTFSSYLSDYQDLDVGNVTNRNVTGLSAGTTYFYRVRAYNGGATSASSNVITVITVPAAPAATTASGITNRWFSANWNSSTGASGYRLDVATNNSFTGYVDGYQDRDVGNVTSFGVKGLSANTNYYYRVRAYNVNGLTGNSNVITVLTTTPPNPTPRPSSTPK